MAFSKYRRESKVSQNRDFTYNPKGR